MAIVDKIKNRLSRNSKERPQDPRAPLRKVDLPKIQAAHQPALAGQGWTTVTFAGSQDPVRKSLEHLFEASKDFFDLSTDYKSQFLTKEGSEDGWNRIEEEKEFITLRTLDGTPKELKAVATRAWAEVGGLLEEILGRLAMTLDLPAKSLTQYSSPCTQLTNIKTATMLRLFRYEGSEAKIVAEPHADLGLLSFVVGDTPGLEVWNHHHQDFWPIEKTYKHFAGTLLGGRQLERLSNARYPAGGHLVRSYGLPQPPPSSEPSSKGPYRYSIVFVLRAHSPVLVNTDEMTTNITGTFSKPLKDITAGQLFMETKRKHFNVNTGTEEREKQKQEILARRQMEFKAPEASG